MTVVRFPEYGTRKEFVLECDHYTNTNGLGATQRAIIDHLATAPAGFDGPGYPYGHQYHSVSIHYREQHGWTPEADLLWHGDPYGIRVPAIATAVYATEQPTPSQIRIVQRAARRLQQLGLVDCWHGCAGYVDRPYRCVNGKDYVMPQAVAALFVALRWDCAHKTEQARLAEEYRQARDAHWNGVDPVSALQGMLHNA